MNRFMKKKSGIGFVLEFKKTPVDMANFEKWLNKEAKNYRPGKEKIVPYHVQTLFHLIEHPEISAVSPSGIKYILHKKYAEEGLYKVLETKPIFVDRSRQVKHKDRYLVVEARKVLSMKEKLDNLLKSLQ